MLGIKIHIKLLIFFVIIVGPGPTCYANDRSIDSIRLSISAGARSITCDSFAMINHLDYVNAINTQTKSAYIDFGLQINWNQKIKTTINLLFIDSYFLNNISFKLGYYPFKNFGITSGYYSFDYFLENYNRFYNSYYNEFTIIDNDGFFQRRSGDQAFIIGPSFRFDKNRFMFVLDLYGGIIENIPFTETITLKQQNSNYIEQHKITTRKLRAPFFFPEISLNYCFIETRKMKIGLDIKGNLLMQDKAIDYDQIIYKWTSGNNEPVKIDNSKHRFVKFEMEIGFFLLW